LAQKSQGNLKDFVSVLESQGKVKVLMLLAPFHSTLFVSFLITNSVLQMQLALKIKRYAVKKWSRDFI